MIRLVGLAGRAGAGKSFAALTLAARVGFQRVRFTDPLKDMLRVLGLGDAEIDGDCKETPSPLLCGRTPRHAMQRLGTEWGRVEIGPTFWVDAWSRRADAALAAGRSVVADDVRFPNEIAAIRERGGAVFWIDRDGASAPMRHVSEMLDPVLCDGVIANNGDERFLAAVAEKLF